VQLQLLEDQKRHAAALPSAGAHQCLSTAELGDEPGNK
jgi:hypothetical protein